MSGRITPHQIAMGVGTGGAMVDVSTYVEFGNEVIYTYGRPDQFSDVAPGTFTFTLNNADGRFTPDNLASPLATRVTEGMPVSWLLGGRLVHSTVLAVEIPADEASWDQIVVTCDDMLGTAGRHELTSLADGLVEAASRRFLWRLDDPDGSTGSAEAFGDPIGGFTLYRSDLTALDQTVTFGVPQTPGLPGTAVTITAQPGQTNYFGTLHGNTAILSPVAYPLVTDTTKSYSFGFWGFWVFPGSTVNFAVTPHWAVGAGYSDSMQVLVTPTGVALKGGANTAVSYTYAPAERAAAHYLSFSSVPSWQAGSSYWAQELDLYLDGNHIATTFMESAVLGYTVPPAMLADGTAMQPVEVNFSVTAAGSAAISGTVSRVSHTLNGSALEENALYASLDERRAVLDYISPEISSAAYNGRPSIWTAPIGYPDVSNTSVLDVYNEIVRTEQGHLFCTTTGTLTSPTEQIQVRNRDRPLTPKASFDVTVEGQDLPAFIRDITNVARSLEVDGPDGNTTVTDATVTGRYVTAGVTETVLLTQTADMRSWGQDRINRGKNTGIRAQTFTVDAYTTLTDRSSDLLALVPGDRVRLTGLPIARLGFATWDGWVIGATETHTVGGHRFQFTFAPTVPYAVYDTDRYANDGAVTLAANITATQTTITVTSTVGAVMSTDTPYTLTIGTAGEQVTVTAVAGNTLTVTRGVNGTTAIAHTTAAPLEVATVPYYAF